MVSKSQKAFRDDQVKEFTEERFERVCGIIRHASRKNAGQDMRILLACQFRACKQQARLR